MSRIISFGARHERLSIFLFRREQSGSTMNMDLHSKADKILLCVERVKGVSEEKYFFKDNEQLNPPSISLRG